MEFAVQNPFEALVAVYVICHCVYNCWNRLMRHLNIRAHGWPPSHCDADGDVVDYDDGM